MVHSPHLWDTVNVTITRKNLGKYFNHGQGLWNYWDYNFNNRSNNKVQELVERT
jgi:hypothetical protein